MNEITKSRGRVKMSEVKDVGLARQGRLKIEWAQDQPFSFCKKKNVDEKEKQTGLTR
jgi:hypothetical protein